MLCPYCAKEIHFQRRGPESRICIAPGIGSHECLSYFEGGTCPSCSGVIVIQSIAELEERFDEEEGCSSWGWGESKFTAVVFPRNRAHKTLPSEVPSPYRDDFAEACSVIDDSPKASAALSRRLLQRVLQGHYSITKGSLLAEIDAFLRRHKPPSYLADSLDAVRTVGNFAAHPVKDTATGQIEDVEPGEAEWLIELLDTLLDYSFVQPEKERQRRAALNAKLAAAGKPTMPLTSATPCQDARESIQTEE